MSLKFTTLAPNALYTKIKQKYSPLKVPLSNLFQTKLFVYLGEISSKGDYQGEHSEWGNPNGCTSCLPSKCLSWKYTKFQKYFFIEVMDRFLAYEDPQIGSCSFWMLNNMHPFEPILF